MIVRLLSLCALGLVLGASSSAQDPAAPPAGQAPLATQAPGPGAEGQGRRGMGGMGMGRGVMGMVTEVASDHFLVKNAANEIYTIHFSANTRMMKQPPPSPRQPGQEQGQDRSGQERGGPDRAMMGGGAAPIPVKATDIKVGDAIAAGGEVDDKTKSIGAVFVMLLDPERAKAMREMQANFGKTWLMGKVTGINETKVTVHSNVDNADHTFMADENTSFRKRSEPITLGDVQVGDNVRVEGATKDGQFVAATVSVMAMPPARGGPVKPQGDKAPQ